MCPFKYHSNMCECDTFKVGDLPTHTVRDETDVNTAKTDIYKGKNIQFIYMPQTCTLVFMKGMW